MHAVQAEKSEVNGAARFSNTPRHKSYLQMQKVTSVTEQLFSAHTMIEKSEVDVINSHCHTIFVEIFLRNGTLCRTSPFLCCKKKNSPVELNQAGGQNKKYHLKYLWDPADRKPGTHCKQVDVW